MNYQRIETWKVRDENTDIDLQKFQGIDNALQSIKSEWINNTLKLAEIGRRMKTDSIKLKEGKYNPIYFKEQGHPYKNRLN